MLNLLDLSSSDEEVVNVNVNVSIRYRNLRNSSNPLEFPNSLFIKAFRLDKQAFIYILNQLDISSGQNCTFIPPVLQLALTLNFLGGGAYQHQVGRDFTSPVSQGKASQILGYVIGKMERILCPNNIKFIFNENTKMYFLRKYNFPGVVGCVDGTHIMILRPNENEHMFFNRKGRHSINCMIICNENYKILAVNPIYGGCSHDSFVWRQSRERIKMEQVWSGTSQDGIRPSCWLLGDSGYPLEPWLMTPYRRPAEDSPESKFNTIHSKARSIVERCIGVLKVRWRAILEERKLRYNPRKVTKIINVSVALHNICVDRRVELPDAEILTNFRNDVDVLAVDDHRYRELATSVRNMIRDSLTNQ